MNFFKLIAETVRIAARSLRGHKTRTFLTMLGVAIGIFAITIIFTLVNSLTYNLSKNINALGPTMMFVTQMPWSEAEWEDWQKIIARPPVDYSDFKKLERNLEDADGVCFRISYGGQNLKWENVMVSSVKVNAITRDYAWLNNFEFTKGRPFSEIEAMAGRATVILGSNVAQKIFGSLNPIDRYVRLKGRKVRVVGVLKKSGADVFGNSVDDEAFVPYAFAAKILQTKGRRIESMIMVRAKDEMIIPYVESSIVALVRSERGLRPRTENDFSVNKPEMIMDMVGKLAKYLKIGGIIISIFSVIVGGFGIGNIMFATVKERTFEIGLQKALGATRGFIQTQFLVEAIFLCLIGGAAGLGLNFAVGAIIKLLLIWAETEFEVVISVGSIVFGVMISVLIGLISGYIPSVIAARMDPIESMRG